MKIEVNYIATKIIEIDNNLLKGLDADEDADKISNILSKKIGIQAENILSAYDENDKCIVDFFF